MNLIGFAFTKLHADKLPVQLSNIARTNNLEIMNVEQEKTTGQTKNYIYRATFRYHVGYSTKNAKKGEFVGNVLIEGYILLSLEEKESKDFSVSWKKKEIPDTMKQPLLNLVLKRCTPKAVELEDVLGLPLHIPIPQIKLNKKE